MARMEDLLMGGDSSGSDDSDAEGTKNLVGGAASQATVPSVVTTTAAAATATAGPSSKSGDSKSELTNRLKNLYSAPPAPVQMPPTGGGQPDHQPAPSAATLTASGSGGGRSIPATPTLVAGALGTTRPGNIPPMVQAVQRNSPGSAQQFPQQGSVGRVPAPLPKAR